MKTSAELTTEERPSVYHAKAQKEGDQMINDLDAEAIESLPVIEIGRECQTCGSQDFIGCNIDVDGNVTNCNQCKERIQ